MSVIPSQKHQVFFPLIALSLFFGTPSNKRKPDARSMVSTGTRKFFKGVFSGKLWLGMTNEFISNSPLSFSITTTLKKWVGTETLFLPITSYFTYNLPSASNLEITIYIFKTVFMKRNRVFRIVMDPLVYRPWQIQRPSANIHISVFSGQGSDVFFKIVPYVSIKSLADLKIWKNSTTYFVDIQTWVNLKGSGWVFADVCFCVEYAWLYTYNSC